MTLSATLRDLVTRAATALRGADEVRTVTPEAGEEQDAFVDRCMAFYVGGEGWESDQAAAVCHRAWADAEAERTGRENPDAPRFPKARAAELLRVDGGDTGPVLGDGRWFAWGMVEKGLGGVNSTYPIDERFTPDFFRQVVANFNPSVRRVSVIGGEDGVSGHNSVFTLGRVTDADFDGLTLWVRVEDIIDPETGVSRVDEAVTRGFTAPSVGIQPFAEEVGGPQLVHVALLAEAEQRGTVGFPYLDEQGAGLTREQASKLQGRAAWWDATAPPQTVPTTVCWRSAGDWRKAMSTPNTPAPDAAQPAAVATPPAAAPAPAVRCEEPGVTPREALPSSDALAAIAAQMERTNQLLEALATKGAAEEARVAAAAEREATERKARAEAENRRVAGEVVELMIRRGSLRPAGRDAQIAALATLPAEQVLAIRTIALGEPVPDQARHEVSLPTGHGALFSASAMRAFRTADGAPVSESSLSEMGELVRRVQVRNAGTLPDRLITATDLIAASRAA